MDNRATYGPEFHRLAFSRAVEQNLLSDYKVVVLALSEQHVDAALQAHLASGNSEINISDAAKIVGCWRGLQNPENKRPGDGPISRLTRAIAFTNTIKFSQRLVAHWDNIVGQAIGQLPEAEQPGAFRCETRHVDGHHHALERKRCIEWLKGDSGGTCRIPLERPVPFRGHRRARTGRRALHGLPKIAGRHRAGRGPRHAESGGQRVRLHRAAGRRSGGR